MLNKVLLIGNLTRDPELRHTANGSPVASFGLACTRKYKQNETWKDDTTFIDITVWGSAGENCSKYLKKGSRAFVEGRLKLDQWQDKNTGEKKSKMNVVSENVQFLDRKGESQQQSPDPDIPF